MLVTIGLADDLHAVAVLGEAVDESDDAGGARKRVAPLLEREVGRDDRRALLVPAAISRALCVVTSRTMWRCEAPMATRTANSRERRAIANASTP